MQNIVTIPQTSGPVVLTFGTFAVRRFCKLTGCTNAPKSILTQLAPDTILDSMVAVILAGVEATTQKEGKPFTMTEFQACDVADSLTSEASQNLAYAFIGSVLGIPATEVPDVLKSFEQAEPDPNAEMLPTTTILPVGSDLPNSATVSG